MLDADYVVGVVEALNASAYHGKCVFLRIPLAPPKCVDQSDCEALLTCFSSQEH